MLRFRVSKYDWYLPAEVKRKLSGPNDKIKQSSPQKLVKCKEEKLSPPELSKRKASAPISPAAPSKRQKLSRNKAPPEAEVPKGKNEIVPKKEKEEKVEKKGKRGRRAKSEECKPNILPPPGAGLGVRKSLTQEELSRETILNGTTAVITPSLTSKTKDSKTYSLRTQSRPSYR